MNREDESDRVPDAANGHQNGHRRGFWSRWFGKRAGESPETLAFRRLAMQLRIDLGEEAGGRAVMLAPPVSSADLGARVSLEFGHFLAREFGHEVLIVDACFNRPWAARYFGDPSSAGLLNCLDRTADSLERFLIPTGHEHVAVMPAGTNEGRGTGLRDSEPMKLFLARVRRKFDYVLISCPPILEDSSGLAFPSLVDCVLLLAVEDETRMRDLDSAQKALVAAKAVRVGLVLTHAKRGRDLKLS